MRKGKSIRFKLSIWFAVIIIALVALSFFAMRTASGIVLSGVNRDYLFSTVEKNTGAARYTDSKEDDRANRYIEYGDGYLEIDEDFLDTVNNVHTALYTEDGTLLYGENLLARHDSELPFTGNRIYNYVTAGTKYIVYDRKLSIELPGGGSLWLRGAVSQSGSLAQLREISRISIILLPILILIAILVGYLLIGSLLSPIKKIEDIANRISRGDDLNQRIAVKNEDDEVGKLAKVFNRMLDRLQNSFEAEKRFTSDVSHELRTPTSVILAQSEYTLERERSADEYVDALNVIHEQGGRMNDLIDDMLNYTRMEQRAERYPMEDLNLSELVSGVASSAADEICAVDEKGIAMKIDVEPGITVSGNRSLLERLLQNLISNAYRYGKEGGHVTVTLADAPDKGAVLTVSDDGIGIPDDERSKIFDRFYRGDASRTVKGTGLGLAMVKKIAELHKAEIRLESEVGSGSRFSVIFKSISEE